MRLGQETRSVTLWLVSASAFQTPMADSVTSVREATTDSRIVGHVSVAAGLTFVTARRESASAAGSTLVDITVKGQRRFMLNVAVDLSQ